MTHELQSKGTYVFSLIYESGLKRTNGFRVNTIEMDNFIGNCTNFIQENGCVKLEWGERSKSHTEIYIGKDANSKNSLNIRGTIKDKKGFLSNFKLDATDFHIMDRAWFFGNGEETIRIFDNGTVWLDNKLGYFVITPINS